MPPEWLVQPEILSKLKIYEALLLQWQSKINLISPNTIDNAWERHFLDCLQLEQFIPQDSIVYDLGSGAGFPGMVLSIVRPDLAVHLIESDEKKCAFLSAVSRGTGSHTAIHMSRIEAATQLLSAPNIVTARALASLKALFIYSHPWIQMNPNIRFLLLKGRTYQVELNEAKKEGWSFRCKTSSNKVNSEGVILDIHSILKA